METIVVRPRRFNKESLVSLKSSYLSPDGRKEHIGSMFRKVAEYVRDSGTSSPYYLAVRALPRYRERVQSGDSTLPDWMDDIPYIESKTFELKWVEIKYRSGHYWANPGMTKAARTENPDTEMTLGDV